MSRKMDPIWKLFNYACDRFYIIEYSKDNKTYVITGFLLDCGGPRYHVLTEYGLCIIKTKEIDMMFPVPMPKDLPNDYKQVIEDYLKERAEEALHNCEE